MHLELAVDIARRNVGAGCPTDPETVATLLTSFGFDWFDDPLAADRHPDAWPSDV